MRRSTITPRPSALFVAPSCLVAQPWRRGTQSGPRHRRFILPSFRKASMLPMLGPWNVHYMIAHLVGHWPRGTCTRRPFTEVLSTERPAQALRHIDTTKTRPFIRRTYAPLPAIYRAAPARDAYAFSVWAPRGALPALFLPEPDMAFTSNVQHWLVTCAWTMQ